MTAKIENENEDDEKGLLQNIPSQKSADHPESAWDDLQDDQMTEQTVQAPQEEQGGQGVLQGQKARKASKAGTFSKKGKTSKGSTGAAAESGSLEDFMTAMLDNQDSTGAEGEVAPTASPPRKRTARSGTSTSKVPADTPLGVLTLQRLPESRRPVDFTVCQVCPMSLWFATPVPVKNYCQKMFVFTWSTEEPHQMLFCDGLAIAVASVQED